MKNTLCLLAAPEFSIQSTQIFHRSSASTLNYTVEVTNIQPRQSHWLFNNLRLPNEFQFHEINTFNLQLCESTFMLQLMNVQEINEGKYDLLSTNSAGSNSVRFILCVSAGKY